MRSETPPSQTPPQREILEVAREKIREFIEQERKRERPSMHLGNKKDFSTDRLTPEDLTWWYDITYRPERVTQKAYAQYRIIQTRIAERAGDQSRLHFIAYLNNIVMSVLFRREQKERGKKQ